MVNGKVMDGAFTLCNFVCDFRFFMLDGVP